MRTLSFPIDNPPPLELSCPRGGEYSMSNREKLCQIANTADEQTVGVLLAMAENYLHQLDEALDDEFCRQLLRQAEADPDKSTESLDAFMERVKATRE